MKTKKVKIGKLKIDSKLAELRNIDKFFVSKYRQAYREGALMPLIIVQKGTNRPVSGNHRLTALLQEYGKGYEITVYEKDFKTELEVLMFFTRENAIHGNAIDGWTREKLRLALYAEGATAEQIARLFNISVKKVISLGDGIMVIIGSGKNKEIVFKPAKYGFNPEHPISYVDYIEHAKIDRGLTVHQQTEQLIRWMEKDLINCDENNLFILSKLKKTLDVFLIDRVTKNKNRKRAMNGKKTKVTKRAIT